VGPLGRAYRAQPNDGQLVNRKALRHCAFKRGPFMPWRVSKAGSNYKLTVICDRQKFT